MSNVPKNISSSDVKAALRRSVTPGKRELLQRFFKTGPGDYGEGDVFLGVMVPQSRAIAQEFKELSLCGVDELLQSEIHEERLTGLHILVEQFQALGKQNKKQISRTATKKTTITTTETATKKEFREDNGKRNEKTQNIDDDIEAKRKGLVEFYLAHAHRVNNWDLVDLSAPRILGAFLLDKSARERKIIYKLVKSKLLWERRIAIVCTATLIAHKQFDDTLRLCEILLEDKHDLMHKACGWMLREVGKRDEATLRKFLNTHATRMPRTMLRYAIERFDENERKTFLLTTRK